MLHQCERQDLNIVKAIKIVEQNSGVFLRDKYIAGLLLHHTCLCKLPLSNGGFSIISGGVPEVPAVSNHSLMFHL